MSFEVKIPSLGESVTEAMIATWEKQSGDYVDEDEILCQVESDKATIDLRAEQAGTLKITIEEGETIAVGDTVAEIDTKAEAPAKAANDQQEEKIESNGAPANVEHSTSAIEKPQQTAEAAKSPEAKKVAPPPQKPAQPPTPSVSKRVISGEGDRTIRSEKMSMLRRTISKRMLGAKQGTAMLTTINEVDMSEAMRIRKTHNEKLIQKYGLKVGFVSFFARACSIALREFPVINGMLDGDEIVYHDYCDISIAVSTDRGLVVPVIKNVEKMNLVEVEGEIASLAAKARENRLTIDEMTGGTFTITNGGVFGSLISTPIINSPQSAILGLHTIQDRPVARDGQVVIKPMMYISLSYDHRLIDGRDSVSFIVRVKQLIEDPSSMLFEV
jgi:2-oxoglutarate dehydrogenase E2 component (dihydrolipoamide succinyltransferase)